MIKSFKNKGTKDIFYGENSKLARKTCPQNLWQIARRKLDQLDSIISLAELKILPGNQFEPLKGDRDGQYNIRINQQYRICFSWQNNHIWEVEIIDYH